jgi:hypothetical protein
VGPVAADTPHDADRHRAKVMGRARPLGTSTFRRRSLAGPSMRHDGRGIVGGQRRAIEQRRHSALSRRQGVASLPVDPLRRSRGQAPEHHHPFALVEYAAQNVLPEIAVIDAAHAYEDLYAACTHKFGRKTRGRGGPRARRR